MRGFEKIVGQDRVKDYFRSVLKKKSLSHSYIFAGSKGLFKFELAKAVAQNLQDDFNHRSADIIVIESEDSTLKVQTIRDKLINDVMIKPFKSEWKIYIIKEAHKMTKEAQNALLKTLEEPPSYAIIILLVEDIENILDTIISRSLILDFVSPDYEEAFSYLVDNLYIDSAKASLVLRLSSHNIGRSLEYLEYFEMGGLWEDCITFIRQLPEVKQIEVIEFAKKIGLNKKQVDRGLKQRKFKFFLQVLLTFYRDIISYKLDTINAQIIIKEVELKTKELSKSLSLTYLFYCVDCIVEIDKRLEVGTNEVTALEELFLNIKEK